MAEEVLSLQTMHDIAVEIRDATEQGVNEASKVGGLLVSIVDLLGDDTGLANFLTNLNNSNYLNNYVPEEGQTIVYNGGYWRFGAAGGGGGSFPAGSVLANLSQYGSNPEVTLDGTKVGYVIKWNGTKWIYAPDESGQGTGDFTKSIFENSKWWGAGYKRITQEGQVVGYRIKGNIIGIKEQGDPNDIPLLDYIQFSNGVKLGVDSATDTIKVYKTVSGTEPDTTVDTGVAHFYATGGVSALGNSSGGGGGGGGDTLNALLADLNDDAISSSFPGTINNKALMYGDEGQSGGTGDWYWGSVGTGAVLSGWADFFNGKDKASSPTSGYLYVNDDSVTLAAGTGGISAIQVGGNNFALAGDSINLVASGSVTLTPDTRTTPKTLTIYASGGPGGSGTVTSVSAGTGLITNSGQPITTSGTISLATIPDLTTGTYTKVTIDAYGRVTSGTNPTDLSGYGITDAVRNNTTWWGQSISNGKVDGTIKVSGESTGDEGGQIDLLGSGTDPNYIHDKVCLENYSGDFRVFRDRSTTFIFSMSDGVFQSPNAIQIGAVKLICEGSNTIKVECANGNAGHLYATGGISALGLSSGSSPSIGNLTVTDKLTLQSTDNTKGLTFTDGTNTTPLYMNDGNLTVGGSGISFGSGVYANTSGFHATNLYATRVYLQTDPNDVYLYWHVEENNNRLRLVVGTTEYDISTSQVPTS